MCLGTRLMGREREYLFFHLASFPIRQSCLAFHSCIIKRDTPNVHLSAFVSLGSAVDVTLADFLFLLLI